MILFPLDIKWFLILFCFLKIYCNCLYGAAPYCGRSSIFLNICFYIYLFLFIFDLINIFNRLIIFVMFFLVFIDLLFFTQTVTPAFYCFFIFILFYQTFLFLFYRPVIVKDIFVNRPNCKPFLHESSSRSSITTLSGCYWAKLRMLIRTMTQTKMRSITPSEPMHSLAN